MHIGPAAFVLTPHESTGLVPAWLSHPIEVPDRARFPTNLARNLGTLTFLSTPTNRMIGLRVKMCVWLGVSRGLDLAFLNAD